MSEAYRGYKIEKADLNEEAVERYELAKERLLSIPDEEQTVFGDYFLSVSSFLIKMTSLMDLKLSGELGKRTRAQKEEDNEILYGELRPENYEESFLNPAFAVKNLGEEFGGLLSFLFSDLRAVIAYAFEGELYSFTVFLELFLQIYGAAHDEEGASIDEFKDIIYWFYHDYAEIFTADAIIKNVDPEYDFFRKIVMESDLSGTDYLYDYGSPITECEIKMSQFMASLPQEKIDAMAFTLTEGYRIGFEMCRKDLSIKRTAGLEFPVGMERVARSCITNFEKIGLTATLKREATFSGNGLGSPKRGVYTVGFNQQYEYDHKNDKAYYLDKALSERELSIMITTYEQLKKQAKEFAGPCVTEIFGEPQFTPVNKSVCPQYSESQREVKLAKQLKGGEITNKYIPGEERSFSIIAYPLPTIGDNFTELFEKTVELNTLDYVKYQRMQQSIIDVLDLGEYAVVKGSGDNHTDIKVMLHPLSDPSKETNFENCVADVNIPVGEVFTSPVLTGTEGVLHVTEVFLSGKLFKNLELTFKDGMITSYGCTNFDKEEENKRYIEENVLFFNPTLPIGEFAIGTNTTAYRFGKDYDIFAKLPILIAEKCGPHFAVGDTCYSYDEDNITYNPDGKAIIARDNEVSILRKESPDKAYFSCHTDITIPYDELSCIYVVDKEGHEHYVIKDGRFAVEGTEELNIPLNTK